MPVLIATHTDGKSGSCRKFSQVPPPDKSHRGCLACGHTYTGSVYCPRCGSHHTVSLLPTR